MKLRTLLAASILLSSFFVIAQDGPSRSSSVSYTPGETGYKITNIPIEYGFRNCYGEIVMAMKYGSDRGTVGPYLYEGNWYSASELGSAHASNFKINLYDLEADLYNGSYRMGTVRIDNLVGFTSTGCFGETYDLLGQLGLDNKGQKWKDAVGQLSLRNIRVISADSKDYQLHEAIRALKEKEEFEKLKSQAESAEASEDWTEARRLYREASYLDEREAMQAKADQMAEKLKAAKNAEKAEQLANEAAELASEEQYKPAAEKYEAAARLDESKQSEYQEKAEEMHKKQNAKEEKEAAASEEENGEESSDSESEGEETEGEDDEESGEGEEDAAATADDSYDEAAAAAQEEYERQERVAEYWENRSAATQANMDAATEMGAQAMLVHLLLGKLIYSNMNSEEPNSHMAGPGNMFSARLGYGFSSVPIFTNSENETYDGNSYGTTTKTENYQSFILELGGGVEYWPVYSDGFGMGASVDIAAGHGLLFEQFSYGGAFSLHGYLGGKNMQIYAAYRSGLRHIFHNPWIDAGEFGSGKAEIRYNRITAGPQYRFLNDDGADFSTLGVLGILERNQGWSNSSFKAAVFAYSPGIRLEWNKRNRFSFGAEAVFNYRRTGETLYGFDSETTFNGSMYNINFHRRFDRFPNSALRLRNPGAVYKRIHKYEGFYLNLLQANLNWITADSSGHSSTAPFIGVDLIGMNYVVKLYKGLGLALGLNGTYSGLRFGQEWRMHRAGITVPLGLRAHLSGVLARYYLEGGYSYHYFFHNSLESLETEETASSSNLDELELPLKDAYGSYRIGAGMAFPGPKNTTSVGIVYERSVGGIIEPTKEPATSHFLGGGDALLNQLSIQFAFQF